MMTQGRLPFHYDSQNSEIPGVICFANHTGNFCKLYKWDEKGNKLETKQEWAEVCFVPNWISYSKNNPDYRYIAIREEMSPQLEFDITSEEAEQETQDDQEYPFQTLDMDKIRYKITGIVTNRGIDGNALINWYRLRCGDSEKIHSIEKSDLAGGKLPSQLFGANAAWWQIMVLSLNLMSLMKQFVLPEKFKNKRMKSLRYHIINVAGQIIRHSRQLIIRLSGGKKTRKLICTIRDNIRSLGQPPPLGQT